MTITIIIFASFSIDVFYLRNHQHNQGNEHIHLALINFYAWILKLRAV